MRAQELAGHAGVPVSRIYSWEKGLGCAGRFAKLEARNIFALAEFIRAIPAHPTFGDMRTDVYVAATRMRLQ